MNIVEVVVVALAALCVTALAIPAAGSDNLYEDLLDNLYGRLSDLDSNYISDDVNDSPYDPEVNLRSDWRDFFPKEEEKEEDQVRDHEYLEHSSNPDGGFIHVSGGAGEGKQHLSPEGDINNTQEVKSDESLPFYCHPPNPCPKGYTEKDGCQTDVPDTVDVQRRWIQGMQNRGLCACDEEHMFNCPKGSATINTVKAQKDRDQIDDMLDTLFKDDKSADNPFSKGNKRLSIASKKSPVVKRTVHDWQKQKVNPYLQGAVIGTVAKKGYGKPIM